MRCWKQPVNDLHTVVANYWTWSPAITLWKLKERLDGQKLLEVDKNKNGLGHVTKFQQNKLLKWHVALSTVLFYCSLVPTPYSQSVKKGNRKPWCTETIQMVCDGLKPNVFHSHSGDGAQQGVGSKGLGQQLVTARGGTGRPVWHWAKAHPRPHPGTSRTHPRHIAVVPWHSPMANHLQESHLLHYSFYVNENNYLKELK